MISDRMTSTASIAVITLTAAVILAFIIKRKTVNKSKTFITLKKKSLK